MASSWQPAHGNVYRSWVELLFDVDCGMKVIQLVGLRGPERFGCILRNTVEVHPVNLLELLTSSALYLTKKVTREKQSFQIWIIFMAPVHRQTLRQNNNSADNIFAQDPRR